MQSQCHPTYHVSSPSTFYEGQNAWNLSPISTGVNGSSSSSLPLQANGQQQRYMPIYEMMQLAGDAQPVFRSVEPLVRVSSTGNIQPMTSLVVADSSFADYGRLIAYDTPETATVLSPGACRTEHQRESNGLQTADAARLNGFQGHARDRRVAADSGLAALCSSALRLIVPDVLPAVGRRRRPVRQGSDDGVHAVGGTRPDLRDGRNPVPRRTAGEDRHRRPGPSRRG